MSVTAAREIAQELRRSARPVTGDVRDHDALLGQIGDSPLVLLGEASHGTHEFYEERARITRRLIEEKGFSAVAVEADWPDALRVNRYLQGRGADGDARQSLGGFRRFPAWMWRNRPVLDFVAWLRGWNDSLKSSGEKAGFYGLDLYSLFTSIEAVLHYLERVDPAAAVRARDRYACFEHFGESSQRYGYAASLGLTPSCERDVVAQLVELRQRAARYASLDGRVAEDEYFYAEQNARVVLEAERYYREMFLGEESSWNLRDRHMARSLAALRDHLDRTRGGSKLVVWEHNSHVGDARATEMGQRGELNVGQLVRDRYPGESVHVGFTTAEGTVTAASDWDAPAERKRVRLPLPGSYEEAFHETALPGFWVDLRDEETASSLASPLLERAIGVVYRPETERASHYFHAALPAQFDSVLHFDRTRAVEPLDPNVEWQTAEPPETYPSGL